MTSTMELISSNETNSTSTTDKTTLLFTIYGGVIMETDENWWNQCLATHKIDHCSLLADKINTAEQKSKV